MKKVITAMVLMLLCALSYAGIESIKQQIVYVKTVTHYVGSNINRYDLGDVDCFVEANAHNLFCIKK